jgi:hypothetical protein
VIGTTNNLIKECDWRLVKSSFEFVNDRGMKLQLYDYGMIKTLFGKVPDLTKNQNLVAEICVYYVLYMIKYQF